METIQVKVSANLAQRLRYHNADLPRILEWGLRFLEQRDSQSDMQQLLFDTLRQVGAIGPDAITLKQYLEEQDDWMPIQSSGQPASAMIIAERASLWDQR